MTLRSAKLAGTVSWDDGTSFDGYVVIGLTRPENDLDENWPALMVPGFGVPQTLPIFVIAPIVDGEYDQSTKLLFNADIRPPNTRYVAWFYDWSNMLAGGPTAQFSVTTDPVTIVVPTLTVPDLTGTLPQPDDE